MKIIFITPNSYFPSISNIQLIKRPSLGALYLATILKKKGYETEVYEESVGRINLKSLEADVFCISSMTSSAKRGYAIAEKLRQSNSDCKIIMGGIHPSTCPEEASKYADHVVIGEADLIIEDIINGKYNNQKIIQGIQTPNLDELPFPDFSLIKNLKKVVAHPLNTSRGCPFNCKFCTITQIEGRKFRFRSPENVLKELETINSKWVINFRDGNFCADKNRVKQILRLMIKKGIHPFIINTSTRLDIVNDSELLNLFTKATNHFYPLIGIESINDESLKYYNKAQTKKTIKKNIKIIKDAGIKIMGQFILGCNFDTKESIQKTIDFINEMEIDLPSFSVLTPYPGTELRKELESQDRILSNNWDYYDGLHVTIKPKNFSPLELHYALEDAYSQVYSSKRLFKSLFKFDIQPSFVNIGFNFFKRYWYKQNKIYIEKLENEDYNY